MMGGNECQAAFLFRQIRQVTSRDQFFCLLFQNCKIIAEDGFFSVFYGAVQIALNDFLTEACGFFEKNRIAGMFLTKFEEFIFDKFNSRRVQAVELFQIIFKCFQGFHLNQSDPF